MNATSLAPLFLAAGLSPVALPEPPAAPAARPADALAAAFKAKIVFQGTAEERAFFESLEDRLLESPTMRELAERFVAAPGTMTARFAELPGTELYERYENLMDFTAPEAGHLVRCEDAATIVLNSACLLIHRDYALEDCGAHLAHEVFGHGLGWMEAGAHGLRASYIHYDDELFARIVGRVFRAEFFRGLPARDRALAARLPRDPEALFQGLGCGDYR